MNGPKIYTVEDPQGRTIEFEWSGAEGPTDADIEEIFASIPEQPQKPQYPPAGASFKPSGEMLTQEQRQTDPLLVGMGKGLKGIATGTKQRLAEAGEYLGVTSPETIEGLRQEAREQEEVFAPLREESTAARVGEVIGEAAPLALIPAGPTGTLAKTIASGAAAGGVTGLVQPTTEEGEVLGNITKGAVVGAGVSILPVATAATIKKIIPKSLEIRLSNLVKRGIGKGIRPSFSDAGKTSAQQKAYYDKAQDAVESIVLNKNNLAFTDDAGHVVKSKLPSSLGEFSDAIHQTKTNLFHMYDYLAQKAGRGGAKVNLNTISDELEKITKSKVLNTERPEIINYINTKISAYKKAGGYTATEAQEAISVLNDSLKSFYKNPSYDTASKAYVDALIANKLRDSLDDVIGKTAGAGYQVLKNRYGALKAIENDVARRTLVDARKNIKGLVDFSDIHSSGAVIHGLTSMNPATLASGATMKSMSAWLKWINDPNRIVKDMFNKADKLVTKINK